MRQSGQLLDKDGALLKESLIYQLTKECQFILRCHYLAPLYDEIMAERRMALILGKSQIGVNKINLFLFKIIDKHRTDLFSLARVHWYEWKPAAREFRYFMAELLFAIDSCHELGIIHHDIKPENILIDRMGHIQLCDFGGSYISPKV